ncbi:MAG: hypothetical protein ABSB94_00960 [Syntrophorhabdales bacterium]
MTVVIYALSYVTRMPLELFTIPDGPQVEDYRKLYAGMDVLSRRKAEKGISPLIRKALRSYALQKK